MYYYNYLLTIYQFLFGNIQQCLDIYLNELKEILSTTCGQDVSNATIWRMLCRQGFTMKKVSTVALFKLMESQLSLQISRVAAEHSAEKRLEYIGRISAYEPRQLVFVDESSVNCRTTYRGRAWSIRGTKAQRKAFFVHGRRYVVTQFYQAFPYIHLVSQYFLQYHFEEEKLNERRAVREASTRDDREHEMESMKDGERKEAELNDPSPLQCSNTR